MLIVLEPVLHICMMLFIYIVIRARSVVGADVAVWLVLGLTSYFTAQHIFTRAMGAVSANAALFAYRQVRPLDTIIVRSALETLLGLWILISLLIVLGFTGRSVVPNEPLETVCAFFGLVFCALGIGLIISVINDLAPEMGNFISFLFRPLYLLSGVIFPLSRIPVQYRDWVFWNPFAHGLELIRSSFFPVYHVAPEANFEYLYSFAFVSIFLGLALQVRFAQKLRAR